MGYGIFQVIETSPNICQYPIPIDPLHHCINYTASLGGATAELNVFDHGGHGFGVCSSADNEVCSWTARAAGWLRSKSIWAPLSNAS